MKKIYNILIGGLGDHTQCAICLEDFSIKNLNEDTDLSKSDIIMTRCKHFFHKSCLNNWLKKNDSCPICKTIIKEYQLPDGKNFKLKLQDKIMPRLLNNYDFENSEFINVDFTSSNLKDSKMHYVEFDECILDKCLGDEDTSFFSSTMIKCSIRSTTFQGSDFKNSYIVICDFANSNLNNCDFMGSNLSASLFVNTKFSNCHFENCDLTGCDFTKAKGLDTCHFLMAIYDEEHPPIFNKKDEELIRDKLLKKPINSHLTPNETLGVISGAIDPTTLSSGGKKKKKNKSIKKKLKKKNKSIKKKTKSRRI